MVAPVQRFFAMSGFCLMVLGRAVLYMPRVFFRWRAFTREMWVIGVQSLPLAGFFLFLIGMVFALQTGVELAYFGQEEFVGRLVAAGMVRELGPWMTAFVLVARNGSSMAAEIGTMSVSEEIAALRIMSISPIDYIVMPRILAFAIMGPMLTVLATCVGILGGMVVSHLQLNVPVHIYFDKALDGLKPPLVLYWSLLKALLFSVVAATIACSHGLRTRGGALGVGRASRDTVVYSLVLIVFLNFVMTSMYQLVATWIDQAQW